MPGPFPAGYPRPVPQLQPCAWMEQFRKNKNITSLDRTLVVSLIERILVFRDRRIEIVFRWQNEFHWQMELLERVRQTGFQKEAV